MENLDTPLKLDEVTAFLESTPVVLRNLLNALPNGVVAWHPSSGEWCTREVVGHLIEEDQRDFVGRIRLMLDHDEPRLTLTDQDEAARMRHDCDKNINDLLDEFDNVRSSSVSFVSTLGVGDLRRGGVHPKIGHLQISNLLHEWIYHDMNHIRQIAANVQSVLWVHLENMQRFYQP